MEVIIDFADIRDFFNILSDMEVLQTRACGMFLCVGDIADGPGSVESAVSEMGKWKL